jgi:hypothetical protein
MIALLYFLDLYYWDLILILMKICPLIPEKECALVLEESHLVMLHLPEHY